MALLLPLGAGYAALLLALLFASESRRYVPVKLLCSAAFVAAAVLCAFWGDTADRLCRMLPGFLLYAAGDGAMGAYYLRRVPARMLWGMGLFFAGHCCFLAALGAAPPFSLWELLLPALAFCGLSALLRLPGMAPGRFAPFAFCYCAMVTLLAARALHRALALPGTASALFAGGTGLLLVSDVLLLFQDFYAPAAGSRPLHRANLAAYYAGMFLLAASLCF